MQDVVVAGAGPAGMVAGLVLARAGVRVTVLEKHAGFLRDFRGDTVHASTLTLLDELGLGEAFAALPHRDLTRLRLQLDDGEATLGDLTRLPGRHRRIALVPQWDLLDLLAREAARWPGFTLLRRHEVTGLLRDADGRVAGVVATAEDGGRRELRGRLTIAADGRGSVLREASGLPLRRFGVPIDVLWFRLPLADGDPQDARLRISAGAMAVLIRRETHWQCALLAPKGGAGPLLTGGAEPLRSRFAALVPLFAARVADVGPGDVSVLDVRLDRLRRWSRPGLLCVGDAAHAMSPVAGVGINLAVQDAVAAAGLLGPALAAGAPAAAIDRLLPAVQRRRLPPAAATQAMQRAVHARLLGPATAGSAPGPVLPLPLRVVTRVPALQRLVGRAVAIGLRPEHAPPARAVPAGPRVG